MHNKIRSKLVVTGRTILNMLQKILQIIQWQRMIDVFIHHSLCNTTIHKFLSFRTTDIDLPFLSIT